MILAAVLFFTGSAQLVEPRVHVGDPGMLVVSLLAGNPDREELVLEDLEAVLVAPDGARYLAHQLLGALLPPKGWRDLRFTFHVEGPLESEYRLEILGVGGETVSLAVPLEAPKPFEYQLDEKEWAHKLDFSPLAPLVGAGISACCSR